MYGGAGQVLRPKMIEVNIPVGVRDGSTYASRGRAVILDLVERIDRLGRELAETRRRFGAE